MPEDTNAQCRNRRQSTGRVPLLGALPLLPRMVEPPSPPQAPMLLLPSDPAALLVPFAPTNPPSLAAAGVLVVVLLSAVMASQSADTNDAESSGKTSAKVWAKARRGMKHPRDVRSGGAPFPARSLLPPPLPLPLPPLLPRPSRRR